MAQPVFLLSVDLQTKTATFTSGLSDAAKSARGSFQDIRDGARAMGSEVEAAGGKVSYSMLEARHSVMILGEEFGGHIPRAISTAIASIGPLGEALEAAFPYLALILGISLVIEHLVKMGEAEEKVIEASNKLTDQMDEGINKAKQSAIDSEIEIRKLAGLPAWDLLAEKLQLQDAEKGISNVQRLDSAVKELIKLAPSTSNLNPFNWFDGSGDVANKAKALQDQLRGKGQQEQADIVRQNLGLQKDLLGLMEKQGDASKAELGNQQKYVAFLNQELTLLQSQADASVLADQAKQGKDRAEKIKQEEEEQRKVEEARQKGFDHRLKIEAEYRKKEAEATKKATADNEKMAEEEMAATAAVMKHQDGLYAEEAKRREDLGKEVAEHSRRMAAVEYADIMAQGNSRIRLFQSEAEANLEHELAAANRLYQAKMQAFQTELGALDQNGKEYEKKQKALNDRMEELTRESEHKVTEIRVRAEAERTKRILDGEKRFIDDSSRGLTDVLMGHQSFAKMMNSLGNEVAQGMIENAIKGMMANDMTKASDASAAARKAFLAGWHFPWPVNIVMAPVLGAMAFAAAMAFETGGIVPGVGRGDVVPAMLTPGEAVLPKRLTEGLTKAANGDGMSGGKTYHVHLHQTNHLSAIDADGVGKMLEKHGEKFSRHVESHLRRMNV